MAVSSYYEGYDITFPYYEGASVSSLVPSVYPASLGELLLFIDLEFDYTNRWRDEAIPMLKPQQDQTTSPSSASLNPEGMWRRGTDSWHHGAGQVYYDRSGADEFRYHASKGVNPWTPYQFTLLNDTSQKLSSANTNLLMVVAGARLYVADGSVLKYTTDITPAGVATWTNVTGYTGAAITGLASDGFTIYFTDAANIWTTNTGTSAGSSVNTLDATTLAFVKSRLMATGAAGTKNSIYNITVIGTPPTALYSTFNTDFTWVAFCEGNGFIYAAGYSGDKSYVFKTAAVAEGTTLAVPTVAGQLPDGERVYSIEGYLGYVLIGTSLGCRFCTTDATTGDLTIGSLIQTTGPVLAFEGQGPFVWFGWTNYDSTSTGLGRMDLRVFTESTETASRKPAYASDLMVTGVGAVNSIVTFQSLTVFGVSGKGIYSQDTSLVASGTLSTGQIGYDIPDSKALGFIDVRFAPLVGSVGVGFSADSATTVLLNTVSTPGLTGFEYPAGFVTGELFEIFLTLTRDAVITTGPTITRWTTKASQGAIDSPAEWMYVNFLLRNPVTMNGIDYPVDVRSTRDSIKLMRQTHQQVIYQVGLDSYNVFVESYQWRPESWTQRPNGGFGTPNGTMFVQLKRIN